MNLIPFVGSNEDKVDEPDLRSNPFQEGGDDGRRPRQGSITRAMLKHLEANEELEVPTQMKLLTILGFEDHLEKL